MLYDYLQTVFRVSNRTSQCFLHRNVFLQFVSGAENDILLMIFYLWVQFHVLSEGQEGFCAMFAPSIDKMWYFCCVLVYLPIIIETISPPCLSLPPKCLDNRGNSSTSYSNQSLLQTLQAAFFTTSYQIHCFDLSLLEYLFKLKIIFISDYADAKAYLNLKPLLTHTIQEAHGGLKVRQHQTHSNVESEEIKLWTASGAEMKLSTKTTFP